MSFPDPVVLLRAFVTTFTAVKVVTEIPDDWDYQKPIVHVVDSGGPGVRDHVMDQRRVTFRVSAPRRSDAKELADLIREKIHNHTGGQWYWISDTAAPAFWPDDAVGKPRYVYTARIDVRRA